MGPNRENIISRSSSVVTGFSLQTNSTFSGGFTSASGKSPTCGVQKNIFTASAYSSPHFIATSTWQHIIPIKKSKIIKVFFPTPCHKKSIFHSIKKYYLFAVPLLGFHENHKYPLPQIYPLCKQAYTR